MASNKFPLPPAQTAQIFTPIAHGLWRCDGRPLRQEIRMFTGGKGDVRYRGTLIVPQSLQIVATVSNGSFITCADKLRQQSDEYAAATAVQRITREFSDFIGDDSPQTVQMSIERRAAVWSRRFKLNIVEQTVSAGILSGKPIVIVRVVAEAQ